MFVAIDARQLGGSSRADRVADGVVDHVPLQWESIAVVAKPVVAYLAPRLPGAVLFVLGVLTLLVLALAAGRVRPPAAEGQPFVKGGE